MDTIILPSEFESGMRTMLGPDFETFRQSLVQPPPTSIRINPEKASDDGLTHPVPWTRYGMYLPERPVFTLDPRFHAGAYYVQEASSMFLEQALRQHADLEKPLNVLDLCAAPGGKSTHLLDILDKDSLVVANEAIGTRVSILEENLERWGRCNVIVCRADPEGFSRVPGFFDIVVVDAPCSGEGLFRKDATAKEQWNSGEVARCSARQKRILADVWPSLKEGGLLVYSTCTFNAIENEDNVQWLCSNFGAEPLPVEIDPAWGIVCVQQDKTAGYRFYPHRVKGEGFFLASIRKTETAATGRPGKAKVSWVRPSREQREKLLPWIRKPEEKHFFIHRDQMRFLPEHKVAEAEYIMRQMRTVSVGTAAATIKQGKLVPEHALALSVMLNRDNVETITLDEATALRVLRREPLHFDTAGRGYAAVIFEDLILGWVNVLPGRINNLYPSHRRIRMALPAGGRG